MGLHKPEWIKLICCACAQAGLSQQNLRSGQEVKSMGEPKTCCVSQCPVSFPSACFLYLLCKFQVNQTGRQRRDEKPCLPSCKLLSLAPALLTALQGVKSNFLLGLCRVWDTVTSWVSAGVRAEHSLPSTDKEIIRFICRKLQETQCLFSCQWMNMKFRPLFSSQTWGLLYLMLCSLCPKT